MEKHRKHRKHRKHSIQFGEHKTDWEMTIRQWLKWIFTGSNKSVKRKWDFY